MVNVATFNLLICVAECEFIYLFIFVGVGGCVVGIMWGCMWTWVSFSRMSWSIERYFFTSGLIMLHLKRALGIRKKLHQSNASLTASSHVYQHWQDESQQKHAEEITDLHPSNWGCRHVLIRRYTDIYAFSSIFLWLNA